MLIVEKGRSGAPCERALRSMFEDRKSVFVDLLKWDLPVLDGRFELDQFDNDAATYLIIADEEGDHLGSARLLPTDHPHILSTLFPHLCASPPPSGPGVFEITRFCLSRRQKSAARLKTRNELVSALAWYALDTAIRTYTGVAEIGWLQQILAFGWNCRPLGIPVRDDCGMIGALSIEITSETPALLAANHIWEPVSDPFAPIPQAA